MCRHLAYLGEDILLSRLLLKPEHSLEKQAWQPKELRETRLNADGFGFAWYNSKPLNSDISRQKLQHPQPSFYRQILPIWNDPNLSHLAESMCQPLWLAMVRSATPGGGISLENTQPFLHKQWSFMHNGYLFEFNGKTQHNLRDLLSDDFLFLIKGNTDSEYIFALLMQYLETEEPLSAIRLCMQSLADILQEKRALLNIVLSDGINIYATKHALNGLCPSLYYTNSSNEFGHNNQLIASEKLNKEADWQCIKDHQIVSLKTDKDIGIFDL